MIKKSADLGTADDERIGKPLSVSSNGSPEPRTLKPADPDRTLLPTSGFIARVPISPAHEEATVVTELSGNSAPAIARAVRNGHAPLSLVQERLWFIDQLESPNAVHHLPIAVRLSGPLDVSALQLALDELIRRHEALRVTFPAQDGQPFQQINPSRPLPLRRVDLTGKEWEPHGLALAVQQAQWPFHLAGELLLRASLLTFSETENVLLLTAHEIILDPSSVQPLLKELFALYEAFAFEQTAQLPAPALQYADFAAWQRESLNEPRMVEHLDYWKKRLSGAPALLALPADYPRPSLQSYRGAKERITLNDSLVKALRALSGKEDGSLLVTLLAAFKTLAMRYTGRDDIVIGWPATARNRPELEGQIGNYANALVLRADLSGDPTFRTLLGRIRETVLEARAHQDLPFEKLVDALRPTRDRSYHPLFQVMFNLHPASEGTQRAAGLNWTSLELELGTARCDLTIDLIETAKGVEGSVKYATDLFDATTIQRMLGHWQTLLEAVAANPELRLSELPLLTAAEKIPAVVETIRTHLPSSASGADTRGSSAGV